MSGFVDINTDKINEEQKMDKNVLTEDLNAFKDAYKNIEEILKQTRRGNAKNKNDIIIKLNQNLMELYNSIDDVKKRIELWENRYGESERRYNDEREWMRNMLLPQYEALNKKLMESGGLSDEDIKKNTKIFQKLRSLGDTAKVLYGGKIKYKRTTRMERKKLMCPKNCCGVSVMKCRCPKSCKHCNCHEIRRLRKKVRTCKKKKRRKKRTKKKRKRRKKRTRRN
jgi:hypothetical protein